jgi:hypothetical protein
VQSNDPTVLIRVRHRDIDPAILTEVFGIKPEYSWKAGEPKPGGAASATRRESYWVAEVPMSPELVARGSEPEGNRPHRMPTYSNLSPLELALTVAALRFRVNRDFWAGLQAEGATAQLIVILEDPLAGFELPHAVLSMLAELSLSLSIGFRDADEAAA